MRPMIDSLYVYRPTTAKMLGSFDKLDQRLHKYDYAYKRGNVLEKADNVYRYALTVKIDDKERTLLLVTLDKSKTNVNKFFKEAVKQIKEDDTMMNTFTVCEGKPELLGVGYVY